MQVCKSYIKLELCWSSSTRGPEKFVYNLCQRGQEKSQVFPWLAVQSQQDSQNWFLQGQQRSGQSSWLSLHWRTCERSNMNRSTPAASPKPLLSLCLQQHLSFAKESLKMNHGHLSCRLVKAVSPSSLWEGLFLGLVFVKRWNLRNLFHFCSYQWKCFISSTRK